MPKLTFQFMTKTKFATWTCLEPRRRLTTLKTYFVSVCRVVIVQCSHRDARPTIVGHFVILASVLLPIPVWIWIAEWVGFHTAVKNVENAGHQPHANKLKLKRHAKKRPIYPSCSKKTSRYLDSLIRRIVTEMKMAGRIKTCTSKREIKAAINQMQN